MTRTVIFAGGGHAHLYSLKRTAEFVRRDYEVILVNPDRFLHYSGMAPGLISGIYRPEEARIDVRQLVERGGGRFVGGKVEEIRASEKLVVLSDGSELRYDALGTCFGSEVSGGFTEADSDAVIAVKPIEALITLRNDLRALGAAGERPRVLVVGGGPAGCEISCNTSRLFEKKRIDGGITLVEANGTILSSHPEKARRIMRDHLESQSVEVITDAKLTGVKDNVARTSRGAEIPFDRLVLAVGISAPDIYRRSGLLTSEDGGLWTNDCLQSVTAPEVFGGGDSISFRGESLPKLGVFAVREGKVLYENLQSYLAGQPLRRFVPQKEYLSVLNCGDGEGLAVRGRLIWKGRSSWLLKSHIDRSFIRRYR